MFVLLIHVTRVGHNLCNPHHWTPGRFKIVLMHGHTCKFLLNTLGRAVEQLAGCLAKQAKSQQSRSKYMTASKRDVSLFTAVAQVTPIAPPTGCGIRPVPNRNLFEFGRGLHGNTYISVLSTLTLTPSVRLPNVYDYAYTWYEKTTGSNIAVLSSSA